MGLCLAISCLKLPFRLSNISLHSPKAPLLSSSHSLSWTLEIRGGISGTHGYTVLIKTTQWNSINKHKQNIISVQAISDWKAWDPLSLSILLLLDWPSNAEGRDGRLDHGNHRFDSLQRGGCTEPQALGRLTLLAWGIGNQACVRALGSPSTNIDRSGKGEAWPGVCLG